MTRRVAVVGGGISGLAAAYRLAVELGNQGAEISLFEASDRFGGVIATDVSQGVVLEGGPDSFLRRKPEAVDLAQELGLGDEIMGTNPQVRGSYIFHRGHFHDIPLGVRAGIPTRLDTLWGTELLSLAEKMRLWGDLALPRQPMGEDIALGSLLRYRLGSGYVDRIAAPMLSGIYAGDIDQLSTAATAPQLLQYQAQGKSLIREAQRSAGPTPRPAAHASPGMFVSLVRGVGSLIDALVQSLTSSRVRLYRECPVKRLAQSSDGYTLTLADGRTVAATDVILAIPAYRAAQLLAFWDDAARQLLQEIPYADLAVMGAVYEPGAFGRPLTRTGFLVPRGEGLAMTAGTWVRAKWDYPDTTPLVPVRAFFGRAGDRELLTQTDEVMADRFRREMGYIMGVTDAPRYERVFRIPQGMPQYLVGHRERAQRIQAEAARWPGLKVIGSYFDGVGVPDCIRHANDAARELAQTAPSHVSAPS